ncbi:hypothetical protein BDF22DRAFT_743656 [Syncephalis plumigaleata]|nr:hypothetical protein BDF22DRAFT_743656 [Syncephalis plumigaleata]
MHQNDQMHTRSKSLAGSTGSNIVAINIAAAQEFANLRHTPPMVSVSVGDMTPDSATSDSSSVGNEPIKGRFRGLRHWLSDFNLKRTSNQHGDGSGSASTTDGKHSSNAISRLRHRNTGSTQSLRARFNTHLEPAFIRRAHSPSSASMTSLSNHSSSADSFTSMDNNHYYQFDRATQMTIFLDASIYEYSDTLHHVFKYYLGRTFYAPIDGATNDRAQRILNMDCGGTDTWAREVALLFPTAEVWNMSERMDDCNYSYKRTRRQSATFSLNSPNPSNFRHTNDKLADLASWSGELFDFVHRRFLHPLLSDSRWSSIVPEMFQVCRPGGMVELSYIGLEFINERNDSEAVQFKEFLNSLLCKANLLHSGELKLDQLLMQAGFVNVKRELHYVPCGEWGDLTGRLLEGVLRDAFSTMTEFPLAALPSSDIAVYDNLVDVCLQRLTKWRAHFSFAVYTAQKPEQAFDGISMYPAV